MPTLKASLLTILAAAILFCGGLIGSIAQDCGSMTPVGTWRGESKCAMDAPACHDERVVYYIEAIANTPNRVSVRADKIVDGKAITMGIGPWNFDSKRQTLSFESSGRLWLLTLHCNEMEGTLTLTDSVVFRRMALTRDDSHPD
jgi:hypothetical protein